MTTGIHTHVSGYSDIKNLTFTCINAIIFLCHESLPLQHKIQTGRTDPAEVYLLFPGCLQELGLQKNSSTAKKKNKKQKKNGAALGFQNLTLWKFRKTQTDVISGLEEPSSYRRIKGNFHQQRKANLRLSKRGWACDKKSQPKSLRKDDAGCGIHTWSFSHVTEHD